MKITLDLGDGRKVEMDNPPDDVLKSVKRLQDSMDTGQSARATDFARVMCWLDEQSEKHGDVKPI